MLKPGGRIVGVHPRAANVVRRVLPGTLRVSMARPVTSDLEEIARAAGRGTFRQPSGGTVPLSETTPVLTALERSGTPKGGKLIINTE